MTLTEFLEKHDACESTRRRAKAFSSLEDAWQKCEGPKLLWIATRPGVLTEKELRLFAVFCARNVQHLIVNELCRNAIDVAEKYANGGASEDELRCANADAENLVSKSTCVLPASRAAYDSAYAAANAAASAAAATAAATAAAACTVTNASTFTFVVTHEQQAAWLRQNTTPNFTDWKLKQ